MTTLKQTAFFKDKDILNELNKYIVKVEVMGAYLVTCDVKAFQPSVTYYKIESPWQVIEWAKGQRRRKGCWEEITEIWKEVKRKSIKDRQNGNYMILVWSKSKGFVGDTLWVEGLFGEGYENISK